MKHCILTPNEGKFSSTWNKLHIKFLFILLALMSSLSKVTFQLMRHPSRICFLAPSPRCLHTTVTHKQIGCPNINVQLYKEWCTFLHDEFASQLCKDLCNIFKNLSTFHIRCLTVVNTGNVSLFKRVFFIYWNTVRPNKKETRNSSYFPTKIESFIKYNFHCYKVHFIFFHLIPKVNCNVHAWPSKKNLKCQCQNQVAQN